MFRVLLNPFHEFELTHSTVTRAAVVTNFVSPLHHSNIHSLATTHPSYPGAVRMLRHWLDSQLFSSHISLEAMELLVASVYIEKVSAFPTPQTPVNGFLRSLKLLASYNWDEQPLYVHFLDEDEERARTEVNQKFLSMRKDHRTKARLYVTSSAERFLGFEPATCMDYPEGVTLRMICAEATRAYKSCLSFASQCLLNGTSFLQSADFVLKQQQHIINNCNVILRFSRFLVKDPNGTCAQYAATKIYKNVSTSDQSGMRNLICRNESLSQIQSVVYTKLRDHFGETTISIFYKNV